MPKTSFYYTLLVRDSKSEPWGIHLGDYSRATVYEERETYLDSMEYNAVLKTYDYPRKNNTLIISTDDTQAEINAKVAELNRKGI